MALLIGRFLAFVRTILPVLAGLSGLRNTRFQIFNWISALLWVGVVMGLGLAISHIPFVKQHQDQVMSILIVLPVVLLVSGLIGTLLLLLRRRRQPHA